MQIVAIPPIDRTRVAAMIPGEKTSLNRAWQSNPETASVLIATFFKYLAPVAVDRLGGAIALMVDFCTLRYNRPGAVGRAPWHTDARFFPPHGVGLTFWCPLNEVGVTAPGVTVRTAQGESTPRLGPGSALVIPPDLEHRTQDIDGERISVEFRCAPVGRLPANVGPSPIARLARRRDGIEGAMIEAEGVPVAFVAFANRDRTG